MRRWAAGGVMASGVLCAGRASSLHLRHLPTRQSLALRLPLLPALVVASSSSSVAVALPRISPAGQAAGYARQRVVRRIPKIVSRKAKRKAAAAALSQLQSSQSDNAASPPGTSASPVEDNKEWKFTGWVSTKRDIKAAVDECVQNIRPKFGDAKPDVCFVFSSHRSDDKLRRIPALVKNALKPRTLFGSSSFGVFGAGGAMTRGKEVTNKQALTIVAASMPDVEIYPFHVRTPSLPSFPPDFDWASHTLSKSKHVGSDEELASALFVITDGFDFREDELLKRLDFAFPSCPKFGGLASARNVRLFVNDKAYPEGAAGLFLHGKFRLGQVKAEAFRPVGRPYTVSEVTPYSEKEFESFLTSVGSEDEDQETGDNSSDQSDDDDEEDDDDNEEDLSSVIHAIDGRSVHDVIQELANDLSPKDKARFLEGQFLVGIDPRVPSSSETRPGPPSVFVARNVKEMEVDSESSEGGYMSLYENVPQGQHIQFCLKDRTKGLADLRAQLALLNLPPLPAASVSTPPVPFCPLALEGAGTSEVGMLGFSSIGRSLYAKNAITQIELEHEGVFPLTGRTPLDSVADQLVAEMRATDNTSGVQNFIEGELAASEASTATSKSNFIAGGMKSHSDKKSGKEDVEDEEDWMAQLDKTIAHTSLTHPKKEEDDDDDIVSYTQEAKRQREGSRQAEGKDDTRSREQLKQFFEEGPDPTEAEASQDEDERRDGTKEEGEEEEESSATDASVIAERFGSRVTFGGMFCKGEFFTTDTRQRRARRGDNKDDHDDDERSTLLHGYINSIAVIMPPKSYHQRKEK